MRVLSHRSTFYIGFILILTMMMGGSAIAAFAGTSPVTTTIKSGNLSLSGPASINVNPTSLKERNRTISYSLPLTVIDARGTGAGWSLSITSTPFVRKSPKSRNFFDFQDLFSKKTLFPSSVSSVTVACNASSTCTLPTDSVTYPVGIPAASTPPPAVQFFNAGIHSGLGSMSVKPMISVPILPSLLTGVFTSNLFIVLNNGQRIQILVTLSIRPNFVLGEAQSVTDMLPFSFSNPGSQDWHLSITSTQFSTEGTSSHTLPTSASALVGINGVCQTGPNCSDNVATYILLPAGNPAPNPVTFYNGAPTTGPSSFHVTAALNIVMPLDAYADTYFSTMTVAFQSGP